VLEIESGIPPLNFELPLRRSLLLAVKEAINNVAKHSEASQMSLKIHRNGSKLVVIVEDNGQGFDLNHARRNRNGLENFSQRMSEAGGECRIVTRPGEGCRVEFSITLTRYLARHWCSSFAQPPKSESPFVEIGAAPPNEVKSNQSSS
jgi:nitrate/nitrite-specific signal transduction histidine kinase